MTCSIIPEYWSAVTSTMLAFLKSKAEAARIPTSVVLGNSACDLDSVVSSILYAYFLDVTGTYFQKENCELHYCKLFDIYFLIHFVAKMSNEIVKNFENFHIQILTGICAWRIYKTILILLDRASFLCCQDHGFVNSLAHRLCKLSQTGFELATCSYQY